MVLCNCHYSNRRRALQKDLVTNFSVENALTAINATSVMTIHLNHFLLERLKSVDFVDDGVDWLAVLHPRLREEQQEGQAQVSAFLDFNDAGADADLDDLLDQLAAY